MPGPAGASFGTHGTARCAGVTGGGAGKVGVWSTSTSVLGDNAPRGRPAGSDAEESDTVSNSTREKIIGAMIGILIGIMIFFTLMRLWP